MDFEWDTLKSFANLEKHRIQFSDATRLWDVTGIEFKTNYVDEERHGRVAILDGKWWTCIYTKRGSVVRIITCRRSRKTERELYNGEG